MGGNHDVYIIEVEGEYRVRPAVAMIKKSTNKLKVRNMTDSTAALVFPSGFLDASNQIIALAGQEIITVDGKDKLSVDLIQNIDVDKHYQYSVLVNKDGQLVPAKGESAPLIIVDP
jgi:hypothetical protein